MAEKETGWTKPEGDGVYWWRQGDSEPPDAVLVRGDVWYDFGDPEPTSVSLGKFLGPISPSDAEQLSELRSQCARLEEALRSMALKDGCWCPAGYWWTSPEGRHSLRCLNIQAVLNPKQPEKETQ